ncbi:MAG: GAF domain-containing protein [Spirochaetales bacterium]|nr:GAF domain-containing protein [Spirochaetales bacterium]
MNDARSDDTRRLLRELTAVERVASVASRYLDARKLCEVVGDALRDIFGTGIVYVALYDPVTDLVSIPYFMSSTGRTEVEPYRLGRGLTSLVIIRKEPLLLQRDAERRMAELGAFSIRAGNTKSWLGVPIFAADQVVGVVSVQNLEHEDFFRDDDVRLLETIAGIVGAAVHNARLYETAKRRADETAALVELGRELASSLELPEVLELIVERARSLLTRNAAAIYLLDDEDRVLKAIIARGPDAEAIENDVIEPGVGIIGSVASSGKSEIVDDVVVDDRSVHVPGSGEDVREEKLMATPLIVKDRTIGVMAVWRGADELRFTSLDLDFLEGLARQAAVAIHGARLYGRTREALAEAERASRVKSGFLAALAREIRAPIAASHELAKRISGDRDADADSLRDAISRLAADSSRLLDIADASVDLAALEAGRLELEVEVVDGRAALREALDACAPQAGRHVRLVAVDPNGAEAPVIADRRRLVRILRELVGAVIERGVGRIECACVEGERETVFRIESGDAPRDQENGSGAESESLGAVLAARLLELQGGKLLSGKGGFFSFTLPSGSFPPLDS